MQRKVRNLNEIARDATIQIIETIQSKGVCLQCVYVDTIGDPLWYQNFLTKHFQNKISFIVRKKADQLFKVRTTSHM